MTTGVFDGSDASSAAREVLDLIASKWTMLVDYRLTALGVCLSNPIGAVRRWAEPHFELVVRAREASDRRAGRRSTGS